MQQIQIDGQIVITVLKIRGQQVQIGIDAPKQTRILRTELAFEPACPLGAIRAREPAQQEVSVSAARYARRARRL
jgi:hypothetical protein